MGSAQAMVGCAIIVAGLAVESLAGLRWRGGAKPDPMDARATLSVVLPAFGIALLATPYA